MTLEEKIWQKLDRAAIPGAWLTVIGDAIEDYRKEKDQQVAEALAALREMVPCTSQMGLLAAFDATIAALGLDAAKEKQ